MGAARKLQGEIDRVLKKVNEGLEEYDSIWEKVHEVEHANQKEKFEAELKKEIKKLQRYRDQIKTWISSADIKDKTSLIDARKSIETKMESFKICEKEAKTKAFSKAALGAAVKSDPKEEARESAREWLNATVDQIGLQIEALEFETAQLQEGNAKKKAAKAMSRYHELDQTMQKLKEHTIRLEQCLRCLDNDTVAPEEVTDLRDMLDLYLNPEDGADPEDSYDQVDDYYSELLDRLDVVDMHVPSAATTAHVKHKNKEGRGRQGKAANLEPLQEVEEESSSSSVPLSPGSAVREKDKERAAALAVKAQLYAAGNTNVKMDDEESRKNRTPINGMAPIPPPSPQPSAPPSAASTPLRSAGSASSPLPSPVDELPSHPSTSNAPPPVTIPPPQLAHNPPSQSPSMEDVRPALAAPPNGPLPSPSSQLRPGAPSPISQAPGPAPVAVPQRPAGASWNAVAAAGTKAQQKAISPSGQPPPPVGEQSGQLSDGTDPKLSEQLAQQMNGLSVLDRAASGHLPSLQPVQAPVPQGPVQSPQSLLSPQVVQPMQQQQQPGPTQPPQQPLPEPTIPQQRPGELQLGQAPPSMLPSHALMIMEGCASRFMPQPSDTDYNTKRFKPRHPVAPANLPPSYPRVPPEILDNPGLFRKMDPEALFFAFYYQPDTYQQYLAAQELKRQSWRYHKNHNAWFQRYAEPSVTTDEFEQGTYVYFDYNIMHDDMQTGWCYRRKENFTFRYDALEDELQINNSV